MVTSTETCARCLFPKENHYRLDLTDTDFPRVRFEAQLCPTAIFKPERSGSAELRTIREWFERHKRDYCEHHDAPPQAWADYFSRLLQLAEAIDSDSR